jgi:hypothetical protein
MTDSGNISSSMNEHMASAGFVQMDCCVWNVFEGEAYEGEKYILTFSTKEDALAYVKGEIKEFCDRMTGYYYKKTHSSSDRIEYTRKNSRREGKDCGVYYVISRDEVWKRK